MSSICKRLSKNLDKEAGPKCTCDIPVSDTITMLAAKAGNTIPHCITCHKIIPKKRYKEVKEV